MPLIESSYRPLKIIDNGHFQTIIPYFFRKVKGVVYERERIKTTDNDFLDLDYLGKDSEYRRKPGIYWKWKNRIWGSRFFFAEKYWVWTRKCSCWLFKQYWFYWWLWVRTLGNIKPFHGKPCSRSKDERLWRWSVPYMPAIHNGEKRVMSQVCILRSN